MQPERPEDTGSLVHALAVFASVRPRLFGIAYRMLGSAADAEDIVQNVWLRWQTTDRSVVLDAPAFLATTVRLAMNLAQSTRSRRETYVGPWLPEPVDTRADPRLGAERGEAVEFAVLLLLEKLSPAASASHFWAGVTLEWIEANAQPSVVILRDSAVVGLVTINASAQGIEQILWVMRPSKLAAISRSLLASRAPEPSASARHRSFPAIFRWSPYRRSSGWC